MNLVLFFETDKGFFCLIILLFFLVLGIVSFISYIVPDNNSLSYAVPVRRDVHNTGLNELMEEFV